MTGAVSLSTVDFDRTFADVLQGLSQPQKTLPSKYFYDARGSRLFDEICELPEYYPTRTESEILRVFGAAMAEKIGPQSVLVEFGSGSSLKTRLLLSALIESGNTPNAYVPLDISGEHLEASTHALRGEFPLLNIVPICADYTQSFNLPEFAGRRVAYFPGSTVGNFSHEEAAAFLANVRDMVGEDGGLLIGVDLKKEAAILNAAYNDSRGVTAEFNLNILRHLNRRARANFDLSRFRHRAFWNADEGRIEMHLVSTEAQTVRVANHAFSLAPEETIRTEISCKYSIDEFGALATRAGWKTDEVWTDDNGLFSVHFLRVAR